MTLPRGRFLFPAKTTAFIRESTQGVVPVGSYEAAVAVEKVRLAMNGGSPKQVFTINGNGHDRIWVLDCPTCGILNAGSARQLFCPKCKGRTTGAFQMRKGSV